jgi:hypothetical protein
MKMLWKGMVPRKKLWMKNVPWKKLWIVDPQLRFVQLPAPSSMGGLTIQLAWTSCPW